MHMDGVANLMYDVRNILHDVPRYLIGEERQLTSILKSVLTQRLRDTSLVVSSGVLSKTDHYSEYSAEPDICIYGYHHSGVTITGEMNVSEIDGITIEGKRHEFAINQCITNMIKLGADILEMNLRQGHAVNVVTVYGIAASYYQYQGRLLCLQVDFIKGHGSVIYSIDDLPLNFCINATCSLLV